MQVQAKLHRANGQICVLQQQAAQQMLMLDSLMHRAEGAEHDVGVLQTVLDRADRVAAALKKRNKALEIVNVVTSCVAAFLAASAGTIYLLH